VRVCGMSIGVCITFIRRLVVGIVGIIYTSDDIQVNKPTSRRNVHSIWRTNKDL
jgi:hypothetical protein